MSDIVFNKTRVLSFQPPPERPPAKNDAESFKWHDTLNREADSHKLMERAAADAGNKDVAKLQVALDNIAPIACFHEASFRDSMIRVTRGTLVEIVLTDKDRLRPKEVDHSIKCSWIAEVIKSAGYFLFCRWLGTNIKEAGFWIHSGSAYLNRVGFADTKKNEGYCIIPPAHILNDKTSEQWAEYLLNRTYNKYTLQPDFEERRASGFKPKYSLGDRVEIINDDQSTTVIPAIIKKIVGRRIFFEPSKKDIPNAEEYAKENLWKDQADDFIFYVGFGADQGFDIIANERYKTHTKAIAAALQNGTPPPHEKHDVTRDRLREWKENPRCVGHPNEKKLKWQEGMVLEIMDRIDTTLYGLKPARVIQVMKHGYLTIGPEGDDIDEDSFPIHQSSSMLFPVGYAEKNGIELFKPKNDNSFTWTRFLAKTGYKAAPDSFFHTIQESDVTFLAGQRLEAVDQVEKLICPVTVKAVKGRMLHISFDGWDHSYDQLYDYRSNDLMPLGWCELHGYKLQAPVDSTKAEESDNGTPNKKKKK